MIRFWLYFPFFCLLWTCSAGLAQTLYLNEKSTGTTEVKAETGAIIEIEVLADLGRFSASGISFFISIPHGPFQVIDNGLEEMPGVQPFQQGPMFEGGMEAGNDLISAESMPSLFQDRQILEYSTVLGPGGDRGRQGTGVVAAFKLLCINPVANSEILINSSPIHETRLVLADGQTERRFRGVQGLMITAEPPSTLVEFDTWGQIKSLYGNSGRPAQARE